MSATGSRQSLLIATAILALASAFTGYEWTQHEILTRNLAVLRRDNTLARLKPVPVAIAATKPTAGPREQTPTTDRLDELIRKAPKVMGGIPLVYPEDLFVDHPALEQAFLEAMRGRTRLKYGPFFALAGLSAQEIESFCQIYADSETRWAELNKVAFQQGVARSDPSFRALEREAGEERKTRLAALLGAERSAKLRAYQDEDGARQLLLGLNNLVATTYRTKDPVTPAQMDALVGITNEFHIFSSNEAAGIPGAFDQAEARAAKVLTPGQMEIFSLILDNQQVSMLRYLEYQANKAKP